MARYCAERLPVNTLTDKFAQPRISERQGGGLHLRIGRLHLGAQWLAVIQANVSRPALEC